MITFADVVVRFGGKTVLELPELAIEPAQVTVVVGENGAGKSTLLLAAAGLVDLARGQVSLGGQPFHSGRAPAPRARRQQAALVLQEPLLLARRLELAVGYGLRTRGVPRAERQRRVGELLERLGLSHLAERGPRELSGGERRLAAFAAAVVLEPRVLLLDEVTSGLDEGAVAHVARELEAAVTRGATVLLATHQLDPLRQLVQRELRIRAGRVD